MHTTSLVEACTRKLVADWRYLRENVGAGRCWGVQAGFRGAWLIAEEEWLWSLGWRRRPAAQRGGARARRRLARRLRTGSRSVPQQPCGMARQVGGCCTSLTCCCRLLGLLLLQAGEPLGRFLDYCTVSPCICSSVAGSACSAGLQASTPASPRPLAARPSPGRRGAGAASWRACRARRPTT